jgi:hypothetical protein
VELLSERLHGRIMMRRLMYLSVTLLSLSLALLTGFHVGQRTAEAEDKGHIVGFSPHSENPSQYFVITESGDVFTFRPNDCMFTFTCNVWE